MAMLRNIRLIHFHPHPPLKYVYLRFLEARIRTDRAVPFGNPQEFLEQTQAWFHKNRRPSPRETDITTEGAEITEDEREAVASLLCRELGLEDFTVIQIF